MMQRICPICDQVMKHAHYCSACHSRVKDPVYMNVTYYLNERHPKNEAHCSYHNGEPEQENAGRGMQKAMPGEPGNTGKNARKKTVPNQPRQKSAAELNVPGNTNRRVWTNQSGNGNRRIQAEQPEWQTGTGTAGQAKPVVKKSNPGKKLVLLYIVLIVLIWIVRAVSSLAGLF